MQLGCRHKVVMFGDLAQEVGHTLHKGQRVAIHGKLRLDSWTDRESGKPRKQHKIIADQIALVMDIQVCCPSSGEGLRALPHSGLTTMSHP